jgi:hypothetical protein
MTSTFVVSTVNAQGVTDPAGVVLDSVRATLPGVTLAGLQEVAPLMGDAHQLRGHLPGRLLGVHHSLRSPAMAGSAVVWDKARCELRRRGVELLAQPEPGDALRRRYGAWVEIAVDGVPLLFMAAHRPLRSTGDQPEFDRNLSVFLEACPLPWIVAMDANARDLPVLARLGRWRHVGIDGFLVSRQLVTGHVFRLPPTRSDHRPLALEVRA